MFAYAKRPVRTAVEVGAGTGKATRLFAGRGVAVTALEPDPDMLSVLQRTTAGLPVIAVRVEFEEFESGSAVRPGVRRRGVALDRRGDSLAADGSAIGQGRNCGGLRQTCGHRRP